MRKEINIAIDGYSSCGKSTLANDLAKKLGFLYIDSGAMYRAITLFGIQQGFPLAEEKGRQMLLNALDQINIHFEKINGHIEISLNGKPVRQAIRSMAVSSVVSDVSAQREIRLFLRKIQQQLAQKGGVVMDGRDIGSVVLPDAELKIFMTADEAVRIKRRYKELKAKGKSVTREAVRQNIRERDKKDTTRKENPLIRTADAHVLNNSHLERDEQLLVALDWVDQVRNEHANL